MKHYLYPSVLQKETMPILKKKSKNQNVIIRYSSMSGVKLTVLLPTLNQLIREVVTSESTEARYVAILCHSAFRCQEYEGFLKELFTFCKDIIEIVDLYSGDKAENQITLKQALIKPQGEDQKQSVKARCKVIISTPPQFLQIVKGKTDGLVCSSLIVDKIDMHIALDLNKELVDVAEVIQAHENLKPTFKTIITTQFKGAGAEGDEQEAELKKAFMGENKALIVQIKEDHRV